jgi:hypothetical protein
LCTLSGGDYRLFGNTKDDTIVQSALWTEVSDIARSLDKRQQRNELVGWFFLGIIGSLIARGMTGGGQPEYDYYIRVDGSRKKLTIDTSFKEPQPPDHALFTAANDAWAVEAIDLLNKGDTIDFGNLELDTAGIKQGRQSVDWSSVLGAQYQDQLGTVSISWNDPAKKNPRKLNTRLGLRGNALIRVVNHKIGKAPSMATRLGKL